MRQPNVKDQGHVSVLKLIWEAEARGLDVLVPTGDNKPYDLVISPDSKTFIRVQVKSTGCGKGDRKNKPNFRIGCGRDHRNKYTKEMIDLFALYAECTQDWYFIPVELVKGLSNVGVTRGGQYEKYRNAWRELS